MAVAERQSSASGLVPARRQQTLACDAARRGSSALLRVVLYVVLTLIFLVPFIWMIFGSLREETEIFQYLYPLSWNTFFPIHWTLRPLP